MTNVWGFFLQTLSVSAVAFVLLIIKRLFLDKISPELHKKAALAAAEQKITLNQYVLKAINRSVEDENANKEKITV